MKIKFLKAVAGFQEKSIKNPSVEANRSIISRFWVCKVYTVFPGFGSNSSCISLSVVRLESVQRSPGGFGLQPSDCQLRSSLDVFVQKVPG